MSTHRAGLPLGCFCVRPLPITYDLSARLWFGRALFRSACLSGSVVCYLPPCWRWSFRADVLCSGVACLTKPSHTAANGRAPEALQPPTQLPPWHPCPHCKLLLLPDCICSRVACMMLREFRASALSSIQPSVPALILQAPSPRQRAQVIWICMPPASTVDALAHSDSCSR